MNEKQEEVMKYVLIQSFKLGATIGSWLDTDMKFCHRAAHSAVDAMMPHFIQEINLRFGEIEREESGRCTLCGKKDKENE